MNPKLSICIPTYNRSKCLKECLDSIMISMAGYESQIEIIISNNASTDDTADIIRSFQIKYPWIRYYRNDINIGAERNFYHVATLATGDYIWIFGDDDKMAQEAISLVSHLINQGSNLIICDFSVFSKDFTQEITHRYFGFNNIIHIRDHNLLMKTLGSGLGFISAVIFRKDIFCAVPKSSYDKYSEYGFSFLYMIYYGCINKCNAVCINKPLICSRSGNSGGYDWAKYFILGQALVFDALRVDGYSAMSTRTAKNIVIIKFVIRHILHEKVERRTINKIFYELFLRYRNCWSFWILCIPIFFIPGFVLRKVKTIKYGFQLLNNLLEGRKNVKSRPL